MKRKMKVVVLYVCVCVCVCRYHTITSNVINRLNALGHLLFLELQIGEIFLFSIEKNGFQNKSIVAR